MDKGKVYVVHNDWIQDPETGDVPYKIGITQRTVKDRYYGLGLKMPGEFICDFAYEFDKDYEFVEKTLHKRFIQLNVNGEWFNINEDNLEEIKDTCEAAGGILITEIVENEIEEATEGDINPDLAKIVNCWNKSSDMKATGTSSKSRRIQIHGIDRGLHYCFWIRKPQEINILLGCWTKKYPNIDLFLKKYDGYIINNCKFTYVPPTDKERILNKKGSIRTIIPINEIDKIIETMKLLIEQTKDLIIKECLNKP